jgi:hypothetical protein
MVDSSDRLRKIVAGTFANLYAQQSTIIATSTSHVLLDTLTPGDTDLAKVQNGLCINPCANPTYNPFANRFSGSNVQSPCNNNNRIN